MSRREYSIRADFLEHRGRRLFFLLLEPTARAAHSSILYLPPFAEEMHKSRRIVASQARELVAAGYNVMLLDLSGCGDAGGNFSDASWQIWMEDATFAAHTLAKLGAGSLTIWGLRLGALLACKLSQGRSDIQRLLLWQPVLNGEHQIDQFLRLRTVASAVSGHSTFDRKALWNELRAGRSLDVAGYELSSAMALQMSKDRLNDFNPGCPVNWLEIGNSSDGRISEASANVIAHWREQGGSVDTSYVMGEPFWRTVNAKINIDLQNKTLEFFAQQ